MFTLNVDNVDTTVLVSVLVVLELFFDEPDSSTNVPTFFSESQGCIFAINFHPCDGQSDLRIDLPKGTDLSREVVIALDTEVGFGNGLVHTESNF